MECPPRHGAPDYESGGQEFESLRARQSHCKVSVLREAAVSATTRPFLCPAHARKLGGGGLCSPAPFAGRRQNLNLPSRQFNLRIKRTWGDTQPTAVDFQDVTQKGLADIMEISILKALSYFVARK